MAATPGPELEFGSPPETKGTSMSFAFTEPAFPDLPAPVADVMTSSLYTEFASLTRTGVPFDTPLFAFVGPAGDTIDVATGLAYPAKAERVRQNPRVGLLLEGNGDPGQPVVSVSGFGAVRDSDIQANVLRYLAETSARLDVTSGGMPWSVMRQAVWYWARIIVQTTPQRVAWWPSVDETDAEPMFWEAPAGTRFPPSDPPPLGARTPGVRWPQPADWRPRAAGVLEKRLPGHLTVTDDGGFPLPFRLHAVDLVDDGFTLDVPAGAPWTPAGASSLCFAGRATFIGRVEPSADGAHFTVERLLPDLPLMADPAEIWAPKPETKAALLERLGQELARRDLPVPQVPDEPPAPTPGSLRRAGLTRQNHRVSDQAPET
jgi:hypothetical protein